MYTYLQKKKNTENLIIEVFNPWQLLTVHRRAADKIFIFCKPVIPDTHIYKSNQRREYGKTKLFN